MKNNIKAMPITIILLAFFAWTSFTQDTSKTAMQAKNKPSKTYQVGVAKVSVWENKRKDGSSWKNFQVEKVYKTKDGQWKTSSSFNESELLELKAVVDKAISEENIKTK